MFYTKKCRVLLARMERYLNLIRECNNRYANNRSDLALYDQDITPSLGLRLMSNKQAILNKMDRFKKLSHYLICRYQNEGHVWKAGAGY